MKTTLKLVIVFGILFLNSYMYGQAPEGVNYQATVRDASGNLMTNQSIDVIFNINQSTMGGTTIYSESQSLTTNAYGGFSAIVGQGTTTGGVFEAIDWAADAFFLNVNVDGNDLGTSQLMSVPYALHAKTAENVTNSIWNTRSLNGDYYAMGESVVIGDSIAHAELLSVRTEKMALGEMIDFRVDTMFASNDILNLETSVVTPDNAQFIECRRGDLKFSVNTDGSVYSKKNITTDSSLIVANEVNSVSTGEANLIPIAYGNVDNSGSVNTGTSNFTVTRDNVGRYTVNISGENFYYTNYSVSLTLTSGTSGFITMNSGGGEMLVYIKNTSGTYMDSNFSFVVYKN